MFQRCAARKNQENLIAICGSVNRNSLILHRKYLACYRMELRSVTVVRTFSINAESGSATFSTFDLCTPTVECMKQNAIHTPGARSSTATSLVCHTMVKSTIHGL